MPGRQAFEGIISVLRTSIQWNALPRELGASSTVHDRFQEWEQKGIEWEWQAVDRVITKVPFGKGTTGPNPTDRAKSGTKRSLLTDGAGIPLALVVDGANRHDDKLLYATLDEMVIARPEPDQEHPQHLCLDAGYGFPGHASAGLSTGLW